MGVTAATICCVNVSVLQAIRSLPSPALQEKIARSLLIPLAIGDILRQAGTVYWVCDAKWEARDLPQALWLSVVVGIALFISRSVGMTPNHRGGV